MPRFWLLASRFWLLASTSLPSAVVPPSSDQGPQVSSVPGVGPLRRLPLAPGAVLVAVAVWPVAAVAAGLPPARVPPAAGAAARVPPAAGAAARVPPAAGAAARVLPGRVLPAAGRVLPAGAVPVTQRGKSTLQNLVSDFAPLPFLCASSLVSAGGPLAFGRHYHSTTLWLRCLV